MDTPRVTTVDPALGRPALAPGDRVTLGRGVLVVLLALLVGRALLDGDPTRTWVVAVLGVVAWALDRVDGYVARRTGTASDRGAALDSGVDGALVLVAAVAVAGVAPWALVGGLLYPVFLLVQGVRPAWRRTLPRRAWRRIAGGALTGTLTIGAAPVWPDGAVQLTVAVAVAWVAWSFVVDVLWLERAART